MAAQTVCISLRSTYYLRTMLHFHVITLFPKSIEPYVGSSIIGRARERKLIKVSYYNPKKFTVGKHKRVDQRPYGGGPGMVLEPTAMLRAAEKALPRSHLGRSHTEVIFFSTDGKQFDEQMAQRLSKKRDILLIAGHYEGVDERVAKILKAKKVSMGPFVLTGGELPAVTVIDAISRFVPGVLGKAASLEASRISSPEVYTRPEIFLWRGRRYTVPAVLRSGHHAKINAWRIRKQ